MTTDKQDKAFAGAISETITSILCGGEYGILLESAIEWIQRNLQPEDVFSTKELTAWARESGYVERDEQ